ncbi:MAG TPA: glycosyltransferase [Methylomirabilota bacterium]|nr:glycosyltransferase [Methylomirabilota bacterium]
MRIVQAVGWYFPDSLGGTEVYVAGLCRRLRAAGQEVLVAAPDPTHADERMYEHDGVPVYRYPIPASPTREEAQGLSAVRGSERFHRWLADRRPDVVHAHTFVTGLGLAELKAAKRAGARVIVTTHSASLGWICQRGSMMRWGERLCDGLCRPTKCAACALQARGLPKPLAGALGAIPPRAGRVARGLRGRLGTALAMSDLIARNQAMQREMLSTVDRFVLLTQWALEAAAVNGAPRERLALNRLGLSQEKVTPKPDPGQRPTAPPVTIGYVGRLDPIKGVHDLARAVARTPASLPISVEFRGPATTQGERRVLDELRALVGGDRRVTFAPAVTPAGTPDLLASYDLLCCPSLTLEGGPTVAIEAHAVGTPVIGTRIGGLAELVTDGVNGRLVAPGDWRGLADVLAAVAGDPAGTVDRWRRALPAARTMEQVAADYLALYAP